MSKAEIFQQIESPQSFSTRKRAGETIHDLQERSVVLDRLELIKLAKIKEVLEHPNLQNLINENKITLGIIKPHANEGRNLPESDEDAAKTLLSEIGEENIVFTFSTQLTASQVQSFYSDVKEKYTQIRTEQGQTVWDTIYNFGQSGPLTFVLIYRENNAIEWWRNKMGKTNPSEADPESIRGKHALREKLPNNLVHGSDSPESVRKEIGELKKAVEAIINSSSEKPTGKK